MLWIFHACQTTIQEMCLPLNTRLAPPALLTLAALVMLMVPATLMGPGPATAQQPATSAGTNATFLQALPSAPVPSPAGRTSSIADARKHAAAGEFTAAEHELAAMLQADPGSADVLNLLGYVLFRENRYTDSLKRYTEAAAVRQPSPDDLIVVSSDYVKLGDYPDAERWLRYLTEKPAGLATGAATATAWYMLGRVQYMQDHPADAAASFQRCLGLRPRDLRAEYNLGLALERLQQTDQALAAYRSAEAWAQAGGIRDAQPSLNLGTLLLAQGNAPEAAAALERAAVLSPENATAFQQLGRALEADGQDEQAVAAYRRAIALAPNAERPHYFLGRLLRRLHRTSEADAEFAAVARLYGTRSSVETPNPDLQP